MPCAGSTLMSMRANERSGATGAFWGCRSLCRGLRILVRQSQAEFVHGLPIGM